MATTTSIRARMRSAIFTGTTPSTNTEYRQTVPFVSSMSGDAYVVGISILNGSNNTWYQIVDGNFSSPPFMNGKDLRFTLASGQQSTYGNQPFKALIVYS